MRRLFGMTLLALMSACSGVDDTVLDQPAPSGEAIEIITDAEDLAGRDPRVDTRIALLTEPETNLAPEELQRIQAETDAFFRAQPAYEGPDTVFNDHEYDMDGPAPGSEVDKANDIFVALTGWAIGGGLAFQDGEPADLGRDHCELFGLDCDDRWHIQALDREITSASDWLDGDSLRSRCGSLHMRADGTTNEWYPCALPSIYPGGDGRLIRWIFDTSACPNNATMREHLRQGAIDMMLYLTQNTLLSFQEQALRGNAEVIFMCDPNLGPKTAAQWRPTGKLTLRYATAFPGVQSWAERCETPGYPGYPNPNYIQRTDMLYTYGQSEIAINWNGIFGFLQGCTTNVSRIREGLRNILLHEFGHLVSFAHDEYTDHTFGVMRTDRTCQQTTTGQFLFSPLHRETINEMDTHVDTDDLDIHDNDLSCFKPFQQ